MKHFIDFQFIEGFHKPLFGKRRHFMDMISVGIIAEDGREYYAISNEFNPKDADEVTCITILAPIVDFYIKRNWKEAKDFEGKSVYNSIKLIQKRSGKSNKDIAEEINVFVRKEKRIEFYGSYSSHDWVLLCSLFGTVNALPKDFPKYCNDIEQTMDYLEVKKIKRLRFFDVVHNHDALICAYDVFGKYKLIKSIDFPDAS